MVPVMAERESARLEEEARLERDERQRREAQRLALERARTNLRRAPRGTSPAALEPVSPAKPPWGTPKARLEAMRDLQRQIDRSRAHGKDRDREDGDPERTTDVRRPRQAEERRAHQHPACAARSRARRASSASPPTA
jgi:hypothetical protein